uniref:HVA22-like protein n=1 Tax=Brassica oleracea TaxID=3712 RepID=A0A3P6GE47_BRAOL|nr:unnamed protein product [Brassica oleracea]
MATATTSSTRSKNWRTVVLFWTISLTIFYSLFQMGLRNSPSTSSSSSSSSSDPIVTYAEQSTRLYDKMERDLQENGPMFLEQGETSQSLSLSDLFTLKDGVISPVLKVANPPVRANVLHLSTDYSVPVSEVVKSVFSPYFENSKPPTIFFSTHFGKLNSNMYHFSMFHASHHIVPVPATEDEVEAEAAAVKAVANKLCPLEIVLDRVLLTSTGVLLGCWKVNSGDDPITIRSKLRSVLPRAPEKQLYDAAILHTSLARLLGPPISPTEASWFWRPSPGSSRTGHKAKQPNPRVQGISIRAMVCRRVRSSGACFGRENEGSIVSTWLLKELIFFLTGFLCFSGVRIRFRAKSSFERMGSGAGNFIKVLLRNFDVLAGPVVSLVYPLHASVRAIETQSHADDKQWLTYWVLYSLLTLFELTFAKLIEW